MWEDAGSHTDGGLSLVLNLELAQSGPYTGDLKWHGNYSNRQWLQRISPGQFMENYHMAVIEKCVYLIIFYNYNLHLYGLEFIHLQFCSKTNTCVPANCNKICW